ncbi:hypothetical protein G9A89_023062, partial [Geosiphon pyriformis]
LEKFTGKKNNAQVWLNNIAKAITTNNWDDAKTMQTILYFLQDTANSWYQNLVNKLQDFNVFKTIDANYFTVPQILNQFIHRLCSITLQDAINYVKDLESAELEANHIQAINLVMNRLSDLNLKLKQLIEFINQKLEKYLANNNQAIY